MALSKADVELIAQMILSAKPKAEAAPESKPVVQSAGEYRTFSKPFKGKWGQALTIFRYTGVNVDGVNTDPKHVKAIADEIIGKPMSEMDRKAKKDWLVGYIKANHIKGAYTFVQTRQDI